jgi:hypothetical protein
VKALQEQLVDRGANPSLARFNKSEPQFFRRVFDAVEVPRQCPSGVIVRTPLTCANCPDRSSHRYENPAADVTRRIEASLPVSRCQAPAIALR